MKGDKELAEALLDSSSSAQYLLGRLVDADDKWEGITNGALMKLGRRYGARVVITALGFMREEEGAGAESAFALLDAVCRRVADEARAGG